MSNEQIEESMIISHLPFMHKTINEGKIDNEILEHDINPIENSKIENSVTTNNNNNNNDSKSPITLINSPNHLKFQDKNNHHQKQVSEQFSELTFSAFIQPDTSKLKVEESRINSFTEVVSVSSQSFSAPKEETMITSEINVDKKTMVLEIQEERSSQCTKSDKSSKELLNRWCEITNRSQKQLFRRNESMPVCMDELYSKEKSSLISKLRSNKINKWLKQKMLNCIMPNIKKSDLEKKEIEKTYDEITSDNEIRSEIEYENGIIKSKVEMDDETGRIIEEVVTNHGGWIVLDGNRLKQMESRLNRIKAIIADSEVDWDFLCNNERQVDNKIIKVEEVNSENIESTVEIKSENEIKPEIIEDNSRLIPIEKKELLSKYFSSLKSHEGEMLDALEKDSFISTEDDEFLEYININGFYSGNLNLTPNTV